MTRPRIAVFLSLLTAAALLVVGCGGGGSSSDAQSTINKGFSTSIGSANVTIGLQLQAQGVASLQQPVSLKLSGPYQSNGKGKLPSLNWQISGTGGGQSFSAAFVSTGDNAFVGFQGQNYEVGTAQVAQINKQLSANSGQKKSLKDFGIDPKNWITNPQSKGTETVDGTDTNHVQAGVDVGKMLTDLSSGIQKANALRGSSSTTTISPTAIAQIKKYVKNPKFDVWVGKSDNKIRRLRVVIDFSVPSNAQSQLNGLKSGTINLSLDFTNVGQKQTITAPANAKPISQLSSQLGSLGSALGGGGTSGGGTSGGSSGTSQQKLQAYSSCIQKASPSDAAALQRCAQLLK